MNTSETGNGPKLLHQVEQIYESKYFSIAFALIFLLIMTVLALVFHKVGGFGVETDFYWGYAPEAKAFLHGKITIDAFHGPLYPWLLALVARAIGDLFTSGVLISVFSASVTVYFVFEIMKSLFSSDVAFAATVLVAVNKSFVEYSYTAGTDMVFVALSMAGLFLLFRKPTITAVELALSALFAACAYLVRYNGLVFLVAIPLVLVVASVEIKGMKKYIAALTWASVFIVVAAAWAIYLKLHVGSFVYDKNYQNIAYELFAKGKMTWDQFWFQSSHRYTSYMDVILGAPVAFAGMLARNAGIHLFGDVSRLNNIVVGVPALVGFVFFALSKPGRRQAGFAAIFVLFFCVLLTVYYAERFSLLLIPLYSFAAVFAFKAIASRLRLKRNAVVLVNVLVAGLIAISYADSFAFNSGQIDAGPKDMLLIRNWFHKEYGDKYDGSLLAARKPHLAHLLKMRLYEFPMVDSYDSLMSTLRRDSVKFLYYGDFEERFRPQFFNLFNIDTAHAGLKPLCITRTPPAVLYELTK